jgi:pimeloyl-ACP methyl ester carboxylesterase
MQVVVNDLLIDYARSGSGKSVVLLHGWGERSSSLMSLQKELDKHFDVIIPDLPGFGGSQAPPAAWGLDDYSAILGVFLNKIKVGPIYALMGHSNGGAVAMRGLASGKLSSERLVLLASAGIRGEYKGRIKAVRYMTKLGKALSKPLPSGAKNRLRRRVYQTVGSDMLVAEHLQATFKKIIIDDVRGDAAKLTLPTLLLYGKNDTQTPVSYGEQFHKLIPGSKLIIFPDSDHFLYLNHTHEVVKSIEEFLK